MMRAASNGMSAFSMTKRQTCRLNNFSQPNWQHGNILKVMALEFTTSYVTDSLAIFRQFKRLADAAIAQLSDEQLQTAIDPESNSVAIIVKHLSGNMRSRWTDFLTTDGEKPDRNRDSEFEEPPTTRTSLLNLWEDGWSCLLGTLEGLTDADL